MLKKLIAFVFVAFIPFLLNAAPTSRTIAGLICDGYGFYPATLGSTCPPPVVDPITQPGGVIAFTDIISGPASGLGDGNGSGAIVTVWGWFGSSQGSSTIEYCDSFSTCRSGYVYYWKDADGTLPGGPANLFESHGMSEVAFSIPAGSAQGNGTIKITYNSTEYTTPFRVRSGNIYHVKSTGSDSNPGTFGSPFLSPDYAAKNTPAGSIVYVHDVNEGSSSTDNGIYKNAPTGDYSLANQWAMTAYPNNQPSVTGQRAFHGFNVSALVFSKYKIFASNWTSEDANGQPSGSQIASNTPTFGIFGTAYGRAVGNYITDISGGCASVTQGAIVGNYQFQDFASDFKIFGNHIEDYGCQGSSKLHHTTYLSIRNPSDAQIPPPQFGFNYLKNNHAKNGIHVYDQGDNCGDYTSTVYIHDNVIINQAGAGISFGVASCPRYEDGSIFNNVIMNAGLPAAWDGLDPQTSDGPDPSAISITDTLYYGTARIFNNTILGWDRDEILTGAGGCLGFNFGGDNVRVEFNDNVCLAYYDSGFDGYTFQAGNKNDNIFGTNNIFYYVGASPTFPTVFAEIVPSNYSYSYRSNPASPVNATAPTSGTNPNISGFVLTDPQLTITGSQITAINGASDIVDASTSGLIRDIYGATRAATHNMGAVE